VAWREELRVARNVYEGWRQRGNTTTNPPNIVGDEWFESLRPNLSETGDPAAFREADLISCDHVTLVIVSLEIGRIEKAWLDEAKG
jgi:hypothetical protein